jgi:hypothetical protein
MIQFAHENWVAIAVLFAVLVGVYSSFLTAYLIKRKVRYDADEHRVHLEKLRESIEAQLYSLNEKLVGTEGRWRDANHLLISTQNSQRADIAFRPELSPNSLLQSAGLTPADIQVDANLVFVLTPFHRKYKGHFDAVAEVCRQYKFKVLRGDEEYIAGDVFPHILKLIATAHLVIAIADGRNPNVFYELGVAHAFGKPTILIARAPTDVPFDIRARRVIFYDDFGDLKHKLGTELARAIASPEVQAATSPST